MRDILLTARSHRWGWKVSLKENAVGVVGWWCDLIEMKSKLSDWTLSSPRPSNRVTPKAIENLKKNRTGANNPMVVFSRKDYDIGQLKTRAKELWDKDMQVGRIKEIIANEFPNFRYQFVEHDFCKKGRGYNKSNAILALLLDTTIENVINKGIKLRGKAISAGQKASKHFVAISSKHASTLVSSLRVSAPQKRLFDKIKKLDPQAKIEFSIKTNRGYRVYDIYSPKINTLIEMHGVAFHRPGAAPSLSEMVSKNIENDEYKRRFAIKNGYKFVVFWDDNEQNWDKAILEIYEDKNQKR